MTIKALKEILETMPQDAEIVVKDPVFNRHFFREMTPTILSQEEFTTLFTEKKQRNELEGNMMFTAKSAVLL